MVLDEHLSLKIMWPWHQTEMNLVTNASSFNGSATTGQDSTANITLNSNSSWLVTGKSTLISLNVNDNQVTFPGPTDGHFKTLEIQGDYTGNNAKLVLNTALGNDTSPTDKLVIGGNASGVTYVSVNIKGGRGADTIEGIEIISVGGTSTNNAFVQNGGLSLEPMNTHWLREREIEARLTPKAGF